MLGLLTVIFHKLITGLRPLIDVRISFLLNILRINGHSLTKVCTYTLILTTSRFGLFTIIFSKDCNRVMALDRCQNFNSAQYLENELTEFDQLLYTHLNWQDLGWNCLRTFFRNL